MITTGNYNESCTPCNTTYYCDQLGMSVYPTKKCANGYVCILGAKYAKPNDKDLENGEMTGRLCAKGHYYS